MLLLSRDQRGFSFTEMMVALAIGTVVVVGSLAVLQNSAETFTKTEHAVVDADARFFGLNFLTLMERADFAYQFQNLPVPMYNCAYNKPCLRGVKDGSFVPVPPPSALSGLSYLQFYRDRSGRLDEVAIYSKESLAANARLLRFRGLDDSQRELANSGLYVTWPLIDETSAPFTVIYKDNTEQYLTHHPAFGSSSPPHDYAFFKVGQTTVRSAELQGRLMVIFNVFDPRQYFLQVAERIVDCATLQAFSECKSLAQAQNPHVLDAEIKTLMAVKLRPLSDFGELKARFLDVQPPLSRFAASGAGGWPGQGEEIYAFPTLRFTLSEERHLDFTPSSPHDIRKIQHYFTVNQIPGQFVAAPVILKSFKVTVGLNNKALSIVSRTFGDPKEAKQSGDWRVEMSDVEGGVVFSRQLGTGTFAVHFLSSTNSRQGGGAP